MRRALLDAFLNARATSVPVALVTELSTGLQSLVYEEVVTGSLGLADEALASVRKWLRDDKSGVLDDAFFVQVAAPAPRLVVVGAVHIAQALAPMAAMAGYKVIIIDPRRAFATDDRFPAISMRGDWPDEALAELKPDRRTAIVTLTHDPKLDDPALDYALKSPAFYIGALGSRKTHAKRLDRMRELGHGDNVLSRIKGPVGLNIGAVNQAEIAVSILAEITAARRQAPTLIPAPVPAPTPSSSAAA